jgi:hypothetical protein
VEYKLVGCVFFDHGRSHFFSHLFIDGKPYLYDDLVEDGKLEELAGSIFSNFDPTSIEINALFYTRVSVEGVWNLEFLLSKLLISIVQTTSRDAVTIHSDFEGPTSKLQPTYIELEDIDHPPSIPFYLPLPPTPDNSSLDGDDGSHIKCAGCALLQDQAADQSEAIQCALCDLWHHVGCLLKTYGLPQNYSKLKVVWACPHCSDGKHWDEHLYVLSFS